MVKLLGKMLFERTGGKSPCQFLKQRIGIALLRTNATCIQDSLWLVRSQMRCMCFESVVLLVLLHLTQTVFTNKTQAPVGQHGGYRRQLPLERSNLILRDRFCKKNYIWLTQA